MRLAVSAVAATNRLGNGRASVLTAIRREGLNLDRAISAAGVRYSAWHQGDRGLPNSLRACSALQKRVSDLQSRDGADPNKAALDSINPLLGIDRGCEAGVRRFVDQP